MAGLRSPFFWRKLICASLALAIGEGLGAVEPKYLYFGVVLLLNDSIGDTLFKVRDRMVGVSLGILMPLLVYNTIGGGSLSNGLVMGGTAALAMALNQTSHLGTALISSGVAFIGYGPPRCLVYPESMDWLFPGLCPLRGDSHSDFSQRIPQALQRAQSPARYNSRATFRAPTRSKRRGFTLGPSTPYRRR